MQLWSSTEDSFLPVSTVIFIVGKLDQSGMHLLLELENVSVHWLLSLIVTR